ncbi:acyl-CoA dehydrogenase family protein [Burkholderia multivorans]|uniref:acyl-CoA dehydrogenase family protein n=1 Tax=Burkholderia multivorans TaxID=87883 RepID=UPI000CFF6987|nr:acyl-CoA dehydrogenase [Burkholderia multivorans]MBR8242882.1 acyl-CoA dehydrogenase family protein [Burkholderia multivorans]MDR9175405.1 Caffeyl-CoA reductase-Etf complex subunit CarC [Burkholderia multivorans]MDR9183362.1 Caffeyl-CoA reductase-Etf complex subunit CarC [Burkholderia multivorans]MDR9184853.1 Caffeyl-CoA reductase-Etf complex subunit CarC [Burkholderia multivorans]MDR9194610.1 Caffeyl-CoA reductase-Etf complex subunit CarC [Burkholderia multivorans]
MDFQHTEDRRMLADTLNRFIAEQYPFAVRDRIAQSADGFDRAMWRRFAELGAVGALFPEADGGFGGAGFDIAVVFECLGRRLVVEPFLGTLLAGRALSLAGGDAHRAMLAALIDGSTSAAFAHDEPGSHYELTRVRTRAERTGDGWVLTGAKGVVDQAAQATFFVVSARVAGRDDDAAGIALFVVPANAAGVSLRDYRKIDGGRAAEVRFERVALPADAALGDHDGEQGAALLERVLGYGLLALSAEALGAMDVAKAHTLDYLRTRKQFGMPIGSFQALQHRMADLLLEVEQARSAVINAAAQLDAPRDVRERALAAAKYTIGRIGTLVAEESIQLHGGIGMTWELPLSHYAKRLVMIDHQLGDEDHHLARYIALSKR